MNTRKMTSNKIFYILSAALVISIAVMIVALCLPKGTQAGVFTPPEFERAAVSGTPVVEEELGYTELYKEGMAYSVSICGVVTMEENEAIVYFTNAASNEKYLKLRILDESGALLGETGLLRPGEYVKGVMLNRTLAAGTKLSLKIMGYEPENYESAGSVVLNVTTGGTEA